MFSVMFLVAISDLVLAYLKCIKYWMQLVKDTGKFI